MERLSTEVAEGRAMIRPPAHRLHVDGTRWGSRIAIGAVVLGLAISGFVAWTAISTAQYRWLVGTDLQLYRAASERWLAGGPWYLPDQVAGPYEILPGHVLYPPAAMPWLVPASLLPPLLWWLIPAVMVGAGIAFHRPRWWAWPLMAACLAFPWSTVLIVAGNPSVWIAGFVALGTIWRPAFALVLFKPSLFPFALFGVRSRGWWVIVGAIAVASVLAAALTVDYVHALFNARGPQASLLYSLGSVPLVALPLMAWAGSTRRLSRTVAARPVPDAPGGVAT